MSEITGRVRCLCKGIMSTNENQQAVGVVLYELEGSVKVCRKRNFPADGQIMCISL